MKNVFLIILASSEFGLELAKVHASKGVNIDLDALLEDESNKLKTEFD